MAGEKATHHDTSRSFASVRYCALKDGQVQHVQWSVGRTLSSGRMYFCECMSMWYLERFVNEGVLRYAHYTKHSTWTSKECKNQILQWTTSKYHTRRQVSNACQHPSISVLGAHALQCTVRRLHRPRLKMLMLWNRVWVRAALGKSFRTLTCAFVAGF